MTWLRTREIERRADEVVGFHVRRLAYAETLPHYSHLVRPTLFLRCTAWHRLIGGVMCDEAGRALRSIENGKARRSGPACASDTVQQAREGRSLATEAETVL